jgi:2-keto-4-pentenoate hydratase
MNPANALIEAYRTRTRYPAAPEHGPQCLASAYAAQRAVWQAMVGDARPRAWKIGAASRTVEPVAAPVFPERLATDSAHFDASLFLGVGVEAEIAFCFGQDLPQRDRPYTRSEIVAAVASAHVALELVDTRLADPEAAGPFWHLSDSLLNAALVIGAAIPNWQHLEFSPQVVRIFADGRPIHEGLGRSPLDDLFHCIPWWIDHVGGARAGDIVTTGAWTGMHRQVMPVDLCVEFPGLGEATVRID